MAFYRGAGTGNEMNGQVDFEFGRRLLKQQLDAAPAERFLVDGNRRERRRGGGGGGDVVETDDRDVLRNAQAARKADAQRGERGGVVVGKYGVRALARGAGRIEQPLHS